MHICAFFSSREEKYETLAPYFRDAIEAGDGVLDVLRDHECTMLCVYDLAYTPASLVSDILATHPYAVINGRLRPSPYSVEPAAYTAMLQASELTRATISGA